MIVAHTAYRKTARQYVLNLFYDGVTVRVCVCEGLSILAAVDTRVEEMKFACLKDSLIPPPKKKFEKLKKNVQVYVHGDDDRTRTKGPSLPFNALLLHSPI